MSNFLFWVLTIFTFWRTIRSVKSNNCEIIVPMGTVKRKQFQTHIYMKKGIVFMMLGMLSGILGQMAGRKFLKVNLFSPEWWKEAKYMQHW